MAGFKVSVAAAFCTLKIAVAPSTMSNLFEELNRTEVAVLLSVTPELIVSVLLPDPEPIPKEVG